MAELGKSYEPVCFEDGKENLNQPYMWLGIGDEAGEGVWRDRDTGAAIEYSNWDDDEGSEGDTCARMQGNGVWRDTVCKKGVRHCVMCRVAEPMKAFTLRGMCAESQIDRAYFLVNGEPADAETTRMNPVYEGYFSQLKYVHLKSKVVNDVHNFCAGGSRSREGQETAQFSETVE